MKNFLALILATLLLTNLTAQKTFYTTGLGEGSWNDPLSWSVDEVEHISQGIPTAEDHVVIRHYLTQQVGQTYIQLGNVSILPAGTLEIIAGTNTQGRYVLKNATLQVAGSLLVAGTLELRDGVLSLEESALAYLMQDLEMHSLSRIILQQQSCGGIMSYGSWKSFGDAFLVCGAGKAIIQQGWTAFDAEGQDLPTPKQQATISENLCESVQLFHSEDHCVSNQTDWNGAHIPRSAVAIENLSAQFHLGQINITWEGLEESLVKTYILERAIDHQAYEAVATFAPRFAESGLTRYEWAEEAPEGRSPSYRVRQVSLTGEQLLSSSVRAIRHQGMNIFPNPSTEHFTQISMTDLAADQTYELTISNIFGQRISQQTLSPAADGSLLVRIDHQLSEGHYLLSLSSGQERYTKKLSVK
ncbi:MAG: T9SS type A sorting domain-containing protein [Bacteroidota bacterium]